MNEAVFIVKFGRICPKYMLRLSGIYTYGDNILKTVLLQQLSDPY